MAKSEKQKQKLLYIAKYLMEQTDESHAVSTPKLIEYLASEGIKAERKSIYNDIDTLNEFGMDIIRSDAHRGGYMLASRPFELAEVKLLIDLVQSSRFITEKKSRELIRKLETLVSCHDAKGMQRQVQVVGRSKASNETIYYNVDMVHTAISRNVQIRFHYFEWDADKKMKLRRDGAFYEVSPWKLTWDDENYYLMAFDAGAGVMKHYRVDKMLDVELTDQERLGKDRYEKIDIAAYAKKTFGMFAGEEKTIRLRCDKALTGVIVDEFGAEVAIRRDEEDKILARMDVAVSPQFFGWLAGLGDRVEILAPEDVKEDYKNYLRQIIALYGEKEENAE